MYFSTSLLATASALVGSTLAAPQPPYPYAGTAVATPCPTSGAGEGPGPWHPPPGYPQPGGSKPGHGDHGAPGSYPGGGPHGGPQGGPIGGPIGGGPGGHHGGGPGECPVCPTCPVDTGKYCLSDDDAQQAADIFQQLIQEYSDELALAALTEDFVDYTSSVAIIINGGDGEPMSMEEPLFVGRQAFMDAQGSQPQIPFEQLNVFHGCDNVAMRWVTRRSANGQPTETARIPVVGNVIIETVKSNPGDEYNFRIKTIYSEFNAAAWLVNLGVFVPENGTQGAEGGYKRSLPVNLRGPIF